MFIGEDEKGTISKIEPRGVTFLENDYPYIGEIDMDLHIFEMMDDMSTPKQLSMIEESGGQLLLLEVP